MTSKRILVLAVMILLLLSSCTPVLSEGEIISKKYTPMRTWISYVYIDKRLVPYTYITPESYTITIKGIVDGKEVTNTKKVPAYIYEKVSVGDWWRVVYDE